MRISDWSSDVCSSDLVERRLASAGEDWTLLDVRDADERAQAAIEGSQHIHVGQLNDRYRDLDRAKRYPLMCASGMRAPVAAGRLASRGFDKPDGYLGSSCAGQAQHGCTRSDHIDESA